MKHHLKGELKFNRVDSILIWDQQVKIVIW